ncbi:MAG TPA: hypothetical protein VJ851_05940 [Jatrophihabitans sp.]|nr:hypothetical protein [Jatrophihabitans sp.]
MQPINQPQVLDPDRMLTDDRDEMSAEEHRSRAARLDSALHESCGYAQQLWDNLNRVRGYLLDSLPPDPRSPGPNPSAGASPTGPDDEQGWQNWIDAYATVTSTLAGPHGDSGYGLGEARREAELRRNAPVLQLHAQHPELSSPSDRPPPAAAGSGGRAKMARTVATAAVLLLALRGLRPRRR